MKKYFSRFLLTVFAIGVMSINVFASTTYATVTLTNPSYSSSSKTSSPVGLGTAAKAYGYSQTNSVGNVTVALLGCWSGYPYTTEASTSLKAGQSVTLTDTQSKSSNFKVKLSGKNCYATGSITLTK